ncbi:hypothetical protein ACFLQL_03335 [Verrucomicrobiota bacterium]
MKNCIHNGFKAITPVLSEKIIFVVIFLLITVSLCLAAGSGQISSTASLKCVKDAIKKAEKEGIPAKKTKSKLPYDNAHMYAILLAAHDYIAKPMARTLKAKLQFKPQYRDVDRTRTIRRPAKSDKRHHKLGTDTVTIEIKHADDQKVIDNYVISGGDVEGVRQIRTACFLLKEAFKDTPLDTQNVRFYCPALKSLNTLLVYLPKFSELYLETEGVSHRMFKVRLSKVETKRKELILIQKEWLAEMTALRKANRKAERGGK